MQFLKRMFWTCLVLFLSSIAFGLWLVGRNSPMELSTLIMAVASGLGASFFIYRISTFVDESTGEHAAHCLPCCYNLVTWANQEKRDCDALNRSVTSTQTALNNVVEELTLLRNSLPTPGSCPAAEPAAREHMRASAAQLPTRWRDLQVLKDGLNSLTKKLASQASSLKELLTKLEELAPISLHAYETTGSYVALPMPKGQFLLPGRMAPQQSAILMLPTVRHCLQQVQDSHRELLALFSTARQLHLDVADEVTALAAQ